MILFVQNPRAFEEINTVGLLVHNHFNKKSWMTLLLFEVWFKNYFIAEAEQYGNQNGISFKILLILDNALQASLHT